MRAKRGKKTPTRPRAATADIVGGGPAMKRVPAKWKPFYERLVRLRSHLTNQKGELVKAAREENSAYSLHMADAGTDSFDRDLALSRASSEQEALYEIDQALNRIRNGTYGTCELTGKRIEPNRLEAIPWARFSVEAERSLERDGAVARARLSPSESVNHTAAGSRTDSGRSESSSDE